MKNLCLMVLLSFVAASHAETPSKPDQFQSVFAIISSDKVFSTSFASLMKQLETLCKPNTRKDSNLLKDGNVECGKETGVKEMDVTGTATPAVTIITSTFVGVDRCEYMRKALTKQYGKPRDSSGDCTATWSVKPGKNGRQKSVGIEKSKDGKLVYFSMDEEQGP